MTGPFTADSQVTADSGSSTADAGAGGGNTSWTADSGIVTADSGRYTADGGVLQAIIRVQAVYDGTYGGQFYEAGDVFDIVASAFSSNTVNYGPFSGTIQLGWMTSVPNNTPLYQARTHGITSIGTWLPPQDGGRRTVY